MKCRRPSATPTNIESHWSNVSPLAISSIVTTSSTDYNFNFCLINGRGGTPSTELSRTFPIFTPNNFDNISYTEIILFINQTRNSSSDFSSNFLLQLLHVFCRLCIKCNVSTIPCNGGHLSKTTSSGDNAETFQPIFYPCQASSLKKSGKKRSS